MDQLPFNPRSSAEWLSMHARRRCAQRGTSGQVFATCDEWADREVPVGRGATALSLSRDAAREMRAEGVPSDIVDRALRRTIVQASGRAVTVIVGRERRGRHYRHHIRPGSDRSLRSRRR